MDEARHREAERRLWASVGATPTERRLDLERTGTTVRVQEIGEGPTVVFVHGGSNGGTSWAPLAARMGGFRCVLVDRPGCGLSEPLTTRLHDVERLARYADGLVVDVLDAMGVHTAMVVATSFGGYVALRSAAAHPDRITRTIEIGWPFGAPIAKTPLAMRLSTIPGLGGIMLRIPPSERMVRSILKSIGLRHALETGGFTQEAVDWFRSMLRDTDTMRNELRSLPPVLTPIKGVNETVLHDDALLASISTPVRFLWGEDDPMGDASAARAFVARITDAELELMPNAGHAPWMDDAEHAAAVVRRFLAA